MRLLIITQKVDENDQLLGFFIEWLARLAHKFEDLTVLCLERGNFELPNNVKVISLGKDRGAGKLKQLVTFYSLIFRLRTSYDVVLVHMNPIWVVLGGVCWRIMKKRIYLWYTHKAVTFKLRLAEKLADKIFTASPESFRLSSKKVAVTGHGIDTEIFKPNPGYHPETQNSKLKLLSVGRIAPVKNYDALVEASIILKSKGWDLSVTMIGEPALKQDELYQQELKQRIKSSELDQNFKFVGKMPHNELVFHYQINDIFVHLSKTGSLDKTLLEAMACGMRVVSSNDAARGFLPAELLFKDNNASDLADKIELVIKKDYDLQLRQYVVENHNLDKLINKISELIIKS